MLDYCTRAISQVKAQRWPLTLTLNIPQVSPLTANNRWREARRDDRREDLTVLARSYGGISAQYTGYGKAEVIVALMACAVPPRFLPSLLLMPLLLFGDDPARAQAQSGTPASGWECDHWGGDCTGTANTCTLIMTQDRKVTATFVKAK
jgi:Divergent InlB B-repeat domain